MKTLEGFYESYWADLTSPGTGEDELRTTIYRGRQNADFVLNHPVIREFPAEDAKFIAYGLGMALELIQQFESWKKES